MKYTQQDRIVAGLKALGHTEVASKSGKYRTFVHSAEPEGLKFFVGKAGAVRRGRIASDTMNVLPAHKEMLIRKGEIALGIASTVAARPRIELSEADRQAISNEARDRKGSAL